MSSLRDPVRVRVGSASLVAGLAILAGACHVGGGGGGGGGPLEDPTTSFAAQSTFDEDDVDHLLLRTQFGVTDAARAQIERDGVPAFVDAMLDFPTDGSTLVEQQAHQQLVRPDDPPGQEGLRPSHLDLMEWWLDLMVRTEHPFQERLAFFLHDHFAVSTVPLDATERRWMVEYVEILRREGIGNFKTLVLDLARTPAMLEWLNGFDSVVGAPNENFAREFLELFTVGVGNGYTQQDVVEAARAFTGYRGFIDPASGLRVAEFVPARKDTDPKTLFGLDIGTHGEAGDDYDLVVDAVFTQLDVARWLAEKLLLEFVSDAPSETMIANLAAVVRRENFEMRPILRALFLSRAFYSSHKQMVRGPVDFGVGLVRSTGLWITPELLRAELVAIGQAPTRPPSVFGWPQGALWFDTAGMVGRSSLARSVIVERAYQSAQGCALPEPLLEPLPEIAGDGAEGDASTLSQAVVARYASLLSVRLEESEVDQLAEYLDTRAATDGTQVDDPFDPDDPQHVDERLRGLVFLLANHPDAMWR
jgi:uncharacterized protein (DUF1800 family)